MCGADVPSSSLSSFCRIMKPTSQSQHRAQVISHLPPPLHPPPPLLTTTACLTPHVNYFRHPKSSLGSCAALLSKSTEWDLRRRHFLSFSQFGKKKTFCAQLYCRKKKKWHNRVFKEFNYMGTLIQKSDTPHPPPGGFLMLHSCVDKQSPVTTSSAQVFCTSF